MNVRPFHAVACLVAAILLTACGGSPEPGNKPPNTAPSAAPQPIDPSPPAAFDATVDLHGFSDKWLPIQFEPKLVPGQTVSLREMWPMDGDTVRVLCVVEGEAFRDLAGLNVTKWFGVHVQTEKASSEARDGQRPEAERMPGGFRAYVGAPWLKVDEGLQAPTC